MPALHQVSFYRLDGLPDAKPTVSKSSTSYLQLAYNEVTCRAPCFVVVGVAAVTAAADLRLAGLSERGTWRADDVW